MKQIHQGNLNFDMWGEGMDRLIENEVNRRFEDRLRHEGPPGMECKDWVHHEGRGGPEMPPIEYYMDMMPTGGFSMGDFEREWRNMDQSADYNEIEGTFKHFDSNQNGSLEDYEFEAFYWDAMARM